MNEGRDERDELIRELVAALEEMATDYRDIQSANGRDAEDGRGETAEDDYYHGSYHAANRVLAKAKDVLSAN